MRWELRSDSDTFPPISRSLYIDWNCNTNLHFTLLQKESMRLTSTNSRTLANTRVITETGCKLPKRQVEVPADGWEPGDLLLLRCQAKAL
jgi:hypothetical protein